MNNAPSSTFRRFVASLLSILLAAGPVAEPAYAAATKLADVPIAAKVAAKPNIVYTLDDSGSMSLSFLPDFTIAGSPGYCRAGNTTGACGSGFTWGHHVPMFTADFNRLYYNPDVTYDPPVDQNGLQAPDPLAVYQSQDAAKTTNWTKVQRDPYLLPGTLDNLVAAVVGQGIVNVTLYCNSDWPIDSSVGVNGEYVAADGKGGDCRINGRRYDAVNGAPAVAEDYNYPWQKSGGADNPKYFWRTNGNTNRTIWCDKTAAGWPSVACAAHCNAGVPVNTLTPQTCNFVSNKTACISTVYSPAGCDVWPAGRGQPIGGCVGTIGVECDSCSSSCGASVINGKNGQCSITKAACNCNGAGCALPACPDTNVVTGCSIGAPSLTCPAASAACGALKGAGPTTLLDDANLVNGGTGSVCRRNNQPAGYASGRYTYPVAPFTLAATSGCGAYPTPQPIPRHYYTVSSVQFCNAANGVANDQWRGFGTGACQSKNDLTNFRFPKYGQFSRVDLVNDGRTFSYNDLITGLPGTRTYAQEMTNYANWYAYYRTRVLAGKTTSAIAFNNLDDTYRAGFHTFNTPLTNWVNVLDFDAAQRSAWYLKLFGVTIATGKTPTLDALLRIGDLYENGAGSSGLPAHTDPVATISGNPVTCQNNYHILFTDGMTNQLVLPGVVGEVDGANVPAFPADPDPVKHPEVTVAGLNALTGSPWPKPFLDSGGPKVADSLADIALKYWATDLRPALTNNVPSNDGQGGKDLDYTKDPAFWQHVNFSAISFGSEGVLDAADVSTTTAAIAAGAPLWPRPTPPNSPTNPLANPGATAIDDLWHATVNARGSFVYARSPIEVSYGLGHILAGISNNAKSRVAASFKGQSLTGANNFIFEATIEPGWAGELKRVRIDTTTAAQLAYASPPDWSASIILDALLKTPAAGTSPALESDNAWFKDRRIVTRDAAGTPVPFLYGNLSASQLSTLASTATQQQKVIAYLRGGSTFGPGPNPAVIEGVKIGQFRERKSKLGDISNSQPLVVDKPNAPWADVTDPGYSAFVAAQAARPLQVFVGANDGMLHSFDGTTGSEVFGYIPSALFTSAPDDGGKFAKGIQALTYQDGGAPIYKHHFYVDSSPRSSDVDFGGSDWHTIVVGGLGKGGNMYYAVDATNAGAVDETQAAAKILWEFTNADIRNTHGRPIIAKTRADGWVVIVTNGYNSVSGKGKLFFLRASDGALLRTMSTTAADPGTPANPSGFTQINGFTKDFHNQIVEQVYGGDLNGNVWRFDVSDPNPGSWTVDLFAQLTDPAGIAQPVTTSPMIEIDLNNGVDRFVFVGTGQLLHPDDLTIPTPAQTQTMYAIRDGTLTTPMSAGLPVQPRATLQSASGTAAIAGGAPNGWYEDLGAGQRIVVDPVADVNLVGYVGTQIQADPCLTSLPAFIYARDYVTGESLIQDSGGVTQASIYSDEGAVGLEIVGLDTAASSFPVLSLVYTNETNARITPLRISPKVFGGGHRMSWRLLGE